MKKWKKEKHVNGTIIETLGNYSVTYERGNNSSPKYMLWEDHDNWFGTSATLKNAKTIIELLLK